eukprot:gene7243-1293_t
MSGASSNIIGLGEVLWDLLPSGPALGGAPANFAWHCNQLGFRGVPVSAVGDDDLGKQILHDLDTSGVSTEGVFVVQDPTGTVAVELTDRGQPSYTITEGVAWDNIPEAAVALASTASAVCFGSLCQRSKSRATVEQFIQATNPDCLKIFDINIRQHYYTEEVVRQSLQAANILKLNDEELPMIADLLGLKPPATAAEASASGWLAHSLIKRFNLSMVALTQGGEGATIFTLDGQHCTPGTPAQVVSTVGAGDSWTAGLVCSLLKVLGSLRAPDVLPLPGSAGSRPKECTLVYFAGQMQFQKTSPVPQEYPVERCLNIANTLAAYVCSQPGAMCLHPEGLLDF